MRIYNLPENVLTALYVLSGFFLASTLRGIYISPVLLVRNLKTEILCNLPKDTLWGNFRAWIQTQICLVPKFIYSTSNLPFCFPISTTKQAYKGLYWMRPWSISNDFKIIWEKWSGDHPIGYCLEKLLSWKIFSKLFLTSPTSLISHPGPSEYLSLPQTLRVESPLNITQLTSSVCIEGN